MNRTATLEIPAGREDELAFCEGIEYLAEDFARRIRSGDAPTIDEYARRNPDYADAILELFPTLELIERSKTKRLRDEPPSFETLGDYRVIRELGRGGMGIVYEAFQQNIGRKVALKVLFRHTLSDPRRLRAFRREAKAAGRLHHTNIVPIFDVDEHEGVPFYVMQYIEGRSLRELIADARKRRDKGEPLAADRWKFAARIGKQVAEAIQYAHDHRIIHRDIKPANLLLDRHGVVWVTDFGVAKLIDDPELTQTGDVVGTLRYLAPESLHGEADLRGDVFALGLTLHELLTLEAFYPSTNDSSKDWTALRGVSSRPARLDRSIPRDFDTILRKSFAIDPADRYQTAGELAEDLGRLLDDRPIRARRESTVARVVRSCRRNKTVAALAAVAAVSLVVAAVSGWAGQSAVRRALESESRRRAEAEIARKQAESNLSLSLESFEDIFNRITRRDSIPEIMRRRELFGGSFGAAAGPERMIMTGIRAGSFDAGSRPFGSGGGRSVSREDAALVDCILTFYDRFAERNETNPRIGREAARARRRVGMLYRRLGDEDSAQSAFRRAIVLAERIALQDPLNDEYRLEFAGILVASKPPLHILESRPQARLEAKARLIKARVIVDQLDRAVAESKVALNLAMFIEERLGEIAELDRDLESAERRFRASVAAAETLVARFPRLPQIEFDRILVELNLASFLHRTSRTDQARAIVEKCRTDFQTYNNRLVKTPINPFMASMIHERLAAAFAELGDESTGSNLRAEAESELETWRLERRNRRLPEPIQNQ
jgi:tRNA A-37 threonylcarbamoyl transferase component Bud32/tetratricopeptide (TPR) repeat protein